jgi:hypothetical protein
VSEQIANVQVQSPEAAEAVHKLKLAAEGTQLRASLSLTREEFERSLQTMQARPERRSMRARSSGSAAPRSARPTAQPTTQPPAQFTTQPPPPPPGKIRIYGLDEGVREIPLTR